MSARAIWTFGLQMSLLMRQPETRRKNTIVWGNFSKQHLLVRGAKDGDFKVNTSLNFVPFNFFINEFCKAIAELLVLDLF